MLINRLTRSFWGGIIVVFLSVVTLALLFGPAMLHPGQYYFQPGGDGIQSYFATAFYALYDGGGQHFSGMNYPVGENFNYPNLQPLIAWGIYVADQLGLPAATNAIAITNVLAMGALALTPLVVYAILRRFRLPVVYAVVMALLIGFLSPQVQRLGDHMSLSYACFMPLLWYCIIRMQEAPYRARWYVLFGTLATLMGLVMLYFLACGCILLLLHAFLLALRRPRPWAVVWRMVVTAVVPLVLTRGWLWFTDTVTDRPPNPYGLLVYVSNLQGVLTPGVGPGQTWVERLTGYNAPAYEAMAYIGLIAALTLLVVGLVALGKLLTRRYSGEGKGLLPAGLPAPLAVGLLAAMLLLFVSFGWPMIFPGLEWMVDYLGPFKQFRALGRFAWPFYYAATVFAAWCMWQLWTWQRQRGQRWLLRLWLPAALLLWAGEAWVNLHVKASQVLQGRGAEDFFKETNGLTARLSWANRRPDHFQAILPLPYFNKGSDRIDLDGSGESMFQAHRLAVTTGLPELSTYVSRPSMTQVLRHVQLLSSPLVEKPLLASFPSRKPILLLVTSPWLSPAELRLIGLSHLLVDAPEGRLYELPLDSLARTSVPQERRRFEQLWPTLPARANGLRATTPKGVLYQPFDQRPDRRGRLQPGAFHEPRPMFSILYDGPLPTPADTGRYEVSAWINAQTGYGIGNMQVKQYAGPDMVDHQVADGRLTMEVQGEWVRLAVPIRVRPGVTRLEVLYDSRDLLADDLLIRPADTDVYWLQPDKTPVLNGYPLR
ncbi:hypothetical protein [Hymenobacter actinosclerus]|uniref:DUF6311 domain-containing protein n=1 Tax=Hymenobacter actinosclerus TaxID=82805 RepID=A0A1I0I7I1_9BACT|nr:hypothetical protein [Hymenobacter actinosclerus]SET92661.1 hypothetical protein SAMN04487998_3194 [Hymenobacter actinosclerus]